MRIICFLFFTIVLFGTSKTIVADLDDDKYDAVIDTKVVEYEENEETEPERPIRKERIKGIKNFVGTNLFGETGCRKKCFSVEDVALLAARRDFESLIPKDLPNCLLDDDLARILMQYFYGANQVIDKMAGGHSKLFSQKAFYDTMGGYLKYYMIPISRYSYYAGLLKLKTVDNVLQLYAQCKYSLNTNGNGWRPPLTDFTDLDIQIEPLKIIVRNEEEDTSCIQLDMMDERGGEDEDMLVALPRLDPEERGVLGNVWLPFKRKRTFDLKSCMSAFVLLRYFELTTRCYNFQGVCQDSFNKKFKGWILENLEIHLGDDILYPGLGAVLRIIETLRRKNKGTIIIAKTNEKRQKTKNYKVLENKAKQFEKNPEISWLQNVFGGKGKDILDDYDDQPTARENDDESRRMTYIYIAILVAVLLLLLVIAIALYLKCRCRRKKDPTDEPKPKKKKLSILNRFKKNKKKDDEEVLLSPESSSIASSQKPKDQKRLSKSKSSKTKKDPSTKRESSSSSSPPQPPKCFSLCGSKQEPDKSATSLDSEPAVENKEKEKTEETPPPPSDKAAPNPKVAKMGTVDEKKRFSISKKKKAKPDEPAPAPGSAPASGPTSAPSSRRTSILKKET